MIIDPDRRFPDAFASHTVPRYAYRAYDCVPASDGSRFSDLDLLVTAGLNARVDMTTFVLRCPKQGDTPLPLANPESGVLSWFARCSGIQTRWRLPHSR